MQTYGIGTLAYFDSLRSGLVPCKVVDIQPGRVAVVEITAIVTANRYAYKRGERITFSGTHIIPRKHVKRFRGRIWPTIIGGYRWVVS